MPSRNLTNLSKRVPPDIRELLGPPPLLSIESATVYYGILASFADFVKPNDLIAWFLIKDIADARVDIQRYRGFTCQLISMERRSEISKNIGRLQKAIKEGPLQTLRSAELAIQNHRKESGASEAEMRKIARRTRKKAKEQAIKEREEARLELGMWQNNTKVSEWGLAAWSSKWIARIEPMNALQAAAEKRFDHARYELERHLTGFARRMLDVVIEGQLVEVSPSAPLSPAEETQGDRSPTTKRTLEPA